jgi:hypothetical protein
MPNKGRFTKILALAGTALAWFSLLAPLFLSLVGFVDSRVFRLDYLMPAELYPFALVGGGLLLWAAMRMGSHRGLIGASLGGSAVFLIGTQVLAVVTGLASGENAAAGWRWILVLAGMAIFTLMLIITGLGGIVLIRELFKNSRRDNQKS